MLFNFIITNLNFIAFIVWIIFSFIVLARFIHPNLVKNISYSILLAVAFFLHIFYGAFETFAQYFVWATGSAEMQIFLSTPLPPEAPLPAMLQWARIYFDHPFGYFSYYVLGRFWINILILFLVAGFLYVILKVWNFYRGRFIPKGPEIMLISFLISGWPGLLVLLPVGLIFWVVFFIYSYIHGRYRVLIEPAFLFATPVALIFSNYILSSLHIAQLLSV